MLPIGRFFAAFANALCLAMSVTSENVERWRAPPPPREAPTGDRQVIHRFGR